MSECMSTLHLCSFHSLLSFSLNSDIEASDETKSSSSLPVNDVLQLFYPLAGASAFIKLIENGLVCSPVYGLVPFCSILFFSLLIWPRSS